MKGGINMLDVLGSIAMSVVRLDLFGILVGIGSVVSFFIFIGILCESGFIPALLAFVGVELLIVATVFVLLYLFVAFGMIVFIIFAIILFLEVG